jgi:nitronate monooxygenase
LIDLNKALGLKHPIILAPMFLVSNKEMLVAAKNAGIIGCLPTHNLRPIKILKQTLEELDAATNGQYGVNLIVNQSNIRQKEELELVLKSKAKFIITSLGNPKEVIEKAHDTGKMVFCDVTDFFFAEKVKQLGADAIVAVNSGAGGHAGKVPATLLIPMLKKLNLPIISAGGVGEASGLKAVLSLGAQIASVGSPFIATKESPVHSSYKEACIKAGADNIILTEKISGTSCTFIATNATRDLGHDANVIEKFFYRQKKLRKYLKGFKFWKGSRSLEKSAYKQSNREVWCAGPSIEYTKSEESISEVVNRLVADLY